MRQADLTVGDEYAYPIHKPYGEPPVAARVRVVTLHGAGVATVQVVDPGPKLPATAYAAKRVKKNERIKVPVRELAAPWADWADHVASVVAEQQAEHEAQRERHDAFERETLDRTRIDPERALPATYEPVERWVIRGESSQERTKLAQDYIDGLLVGYRVQPADIQALTSELPLMVVRDIMAARGLQARSVGTVGSTFARAARLLDDAYQSSREARPHIGDHHTQPHIILQDHDADFVHAVVAATAMSGAELLLPDVPPLPDWIDDETRILAQTLGWLRVAVGDTSGQRLHEPGCRILKSQTDPLADAEHRPWWSVVIEPRDRPCANCGGPALRDLVALIGFTAAADVWHERPDRLESWQFRGVLHLIAAASTARAQQGEADVTLASRIVTALAVDAPGEEGWSAYALVASPFNHSAQRIRESLSGPDAEAARTVLRSRLSIVEAVLPGAMRPLPLPKHAEVPVLRERHKALHDLVGTVTPNLDRLLFTLPNAW